MRLRRAERSDALAVLAWRNDPHTRAMSRDSAPVEEAAHLAWFERALWAADRLLLIGEEMGAPVGMVRFDRLAAIWEVSINVAPEARGRGVGAALLAAGLKRFARDHPGQSVAAAVRPGNAASVRLFEAAGFRRCGEEGGLLRYRLPAN